MRRSHLLAQAFTHNATMMQGHMTPAMPAAPAAPLPGQDGALPQHAALLPVVLDTNIALDVLLFNDPHAAPLRAALQAGRLRWLATLRMREELQRVLAYPHIAARMQFYQCTAQHIMAQYDACTAVVDAAPRCAYVCKDADDQCFIDLAVAHNALLLSKDAQVLKLRKRLAKIGITVQQRLEQLG